MFPRLITYSLSKMKKQHKYFKSSDKTDWLFSLEVYMVCVLSLFSSLLKYLLWYTCIFLQKNASSLEKVQKCTGIYNPSIIHYLLDVWQKIGQNQVLCFPFLNYNHTFKILWPCKRGWEGFEKRLQGFHCIIYPKLCDHEFCYKFK